MRNLKNRFSKTVYLLAALILLVPNLHAQKERQKELAEFENFVIKAKELGATHVDVTFTIPPALWQFTVPNDPYPEWFAIQPGLMKIFPSEKLKPYVDTEYSERVIALLQARCEVLRKYGMKAAYNCNEPYVLPEPFFADYPEYRGPRVDHPYRSRSAYFAPCVDNPEVLEMYRETMQILLKKCPEIEIFSFLTSDSGSGFCWSDALYTGKNGNASCEHRHMGDRVVGFMENLKSAANAIDKSIDVRLNPQPVRQWMIGTFEYPEIISSRLSEGLTLNSRSHYGISLKDDGYYATISPAWGREGFSPISGLNNPVYRAESLMGVFDKEQGDKKMIVGFDNPLYMDLCEVLKKEKPSGKLEMMQALRSFAVTQAGEEGADDLLEVWLALHEIANDLQVLNFGPIFDMGLLLGRWINRPLVPLPEKLTDEEKSYYRPYLFQARGEEQANNLIDIQAMRMFEGYGARLLVQRVYEMVDAKIDKADKHVAHLIEIADEESVQEWKNLQNSLLVLRSFMRTVDNIVAYQALLDLNHSRGNEPEENPVLGTNTSWDRAEIMRIARNEIDNAVSLKKLIESSPVPLITTALVPEEETSRSLSPNLPEQLKLKIDIMNAHWEDYKELYTFPNF